MAKSNDRKTSFSITDDMIKEALELGLSSVKASDDLINLTLKKCQAETEDKQKKKSRRFMTMTYKLGAPLAAGALILVLIINGTGLFSAKKSNDMANAPQAPAPEDAVSIASATPAGEAGLRNKNDEEYSVNYDSAAVEEMPENPRVKGEEFDDLKERSEGLTTMHFAENLSSLNSLESRTVNNIELSLDESIINFISITNQYNLNNGTNLSLAVDSITRIHTLLKGGVNAETLLNASDYHEILSGEGYWALPLKNQNGNIDIVLTVATFDINDPDTPLSNRDTIYSIKNKNYIVSSFENSSFVGAELDKLLNSNEVSGMIIEMDYEYDNNAEIIVADINYGTDFIILTKTKNEKLAIPLLTNESLFGVVSKKVYTWPEFIKIVSSSIGQ